MVGTDRRFAIWLRQQLRRRQWNQADFARESGFSSGVVSSWGTGKRVPSTESADRIATTLGVDLDEVLDLIGARPSPTAIEDGDLKRLQALLRRVKLNPDRVTGLENILRGWITYDREQAAGDQSK